MPLSDALKTIIATEITGRISDFKINRSAGSQGEDDFKLLIDTLACAVQSGTAIPADPRAREFIDDLKEYLEPIFVSEGDANRDMILDHVNKLITNRRTQLETISRSDRERKEYIDTQEKHRADVAASHAIMRRAQPPFGVARTDPRPFHEVLRDHEIGLPWGMDAEMARAHAEAMAGAGAHSAPPPYPLASSAAAAPPHPMGAAPPHLMAAVPPHMAAAAGPVGHHPVVGAPLPPRIAGDPNIRELIRREFLTEQDIPILLRESTSDERLLCAARIARNPQIWPRLERREIGFIYIYRLVTPGLQDAQIIRDILARADD